jgi:hypothetical protein
LSERIFSLTSFFAAERYLTSAASTFAFSTICEGWTATENE